MRFSIDEYKRKLQVRAAQGGKRGKSVSDDFVFEGLQKKYLDFCVEKTLNPDHKLLASLKIRSFVLKLDTFSDEELSLHMTFLQKTTGLRHISLSLGSGPVDRVVKKKFERLGLSKSPAFKKETAALIIRSACAAAVHSPHIVRFQVRGIAISEPQATLVSKAITKSDKIEVVSLADTKLGDKGLAALSIALGKRPHLLHVNLSGCLLTDDAKEHIAKIIALHGTLRDEAAWSSNLRGPQVLREQQRPSLMVDLSYNALGDATCDAICAALFHDKWVLGIQLSHNQLTAKGLAQLQDTLLHHNTTVAVVEVSDTRGMIPTDDGRVIAQSIRAITHKQFRLLRQFSAESNGRRLFLCNLLVEWCVDQELILRLCENVHESRDEPPLAVADNQEPDHGTTSACDTHCPPPTYAPVDGSSHLPTIKFLLDRMTAMETAHSKTAEYVARLEKDNSELRTKIRALQARGVEIATGSCAPVLEETVIAQLENSITVLANQIEALELERTGTN